MGSEKNQLLLNTIQEVHNVVITLLNIESLKKHVKDFLRKKVFNRPNGVFYINAFSPLNILLFTK